MENKFAILFSEQQQLKDHIAAIENRISADTMAAAGFDPSAVGAVRGTKSQGGNSGGNPKCKGLWDKADISQNQEAKKAKFCCCMKSWGPSFCTTRNGGCCGQPPIYEHDPLH